MRLCEEQKIIWRAYQFPESGSHVVYVSAGTISGSSLGRDHGVKEGFWLI